MESPTQSRGAPGRSRRQGQTLAEFALTLPLLLIMIFGIVEFGRAFQAWVTLQNAARAAARYASIGSINYDIFIPDASLPENRDAEGNPLPTDLQVQNTIVPCIGATDAQRLSLPSPDLRGTKGEINGTQAYVNGKESLFATWYDGTDCESANEDHQQFRKDILRLFSIMNEAREASSSLLVEANRYQNLNANAARDILYDTWQLPRPGNHASPRYFDVMICSSRSFLDEFSEPASSSFDGSRFITVRNDRDLVDTQNQLAQDYPFPICMLNEVPPVETPTGDPRTDQLDNSGVRWLDAGGPGERVTISIAFNHPLVTPLFNQQYIFMEARRSIVNESFRPPRAVGAFQRSLPPGSTEDPGAPPTETPEPTLTPSLTNSPTQTPSLTPTPTPEPFECDKITAEWAPSPFLGDTFYMVVKNANKQSIDLTFTLLAWDSLPDFLPMYLATMSLDDQVYWAGGQVPPANQPQVQATTADPTFYPDSYRTIAANSEARWKGYFRNGPTNLASYFQLWNFDAEFRFTNEEGIDCIIALQRPPEPEPTEPPVPTPGPSPTPTRVCAALSQVSVSPARFLTRGVVYFEVTNNTTRPTSMFGFRLVWPDPTHPDVRLAAGAYRLARVTVGGDGPTDAATVPVWESASDTQDATGNTSVTVPYNFGTVSTNAAEGTWLGDAIINPGTTRVYLDFEGSGLIGRMSDSPYNHKDFHYHGGFLDLGCRGGGGGGGGGGGENGEIGIIAPSPTLRPTQGPTKTPGPTKPPTATNRPSTPAPTRTPAPATNTPTNPPPTVRPSPTPLNQPTQKPGSGGE